MRKRLLNLGLVGLLMATLSSCEWSKNPGFSTMSIRIDAAATATVDLRSGLTIDPARLAATVGPLLFPQAGVPTWQARSSTTIRIVIAHVFVPGPHPRITIDMTAAREALTSMGIRGFSVELSVPDMQPTVDWKQPPDVDVQHPPGSWSWGYGVASSTPVGSISLVPRPWLGALGAALSLGSLTALLIAVATAFRRRKRVRPVTVALTVTWVVLVAQLAEIALTGATLTGNLAAAGIATAAQFHVLVWLTRFAFVIPLVAHVSVALARRVGSRHVRDELANSGEPTDRPAARDSDPLGLFD